MARYTRSRPMRDQPRVIDVNHRVTTGHGDVYNWQFSHIASGWTAVTRFGYNRLYLNRLDQGFGVGLAGVSFGFNTGGAEAFQKRAATQTWEQTAGAGARAALAAIRRNYSEAESGRIDDNTSNFQLLESGRLPGQHSQSDPDQFPGSVYRCAPTSSGASCRTTGAFVPT